MISISKSGKLAGFFANGIWMTALTCLLVVAGTFFSVFSYAALALAVIAIVILSEEDSLCLMTFMMSFANIFKNHPEAQSFFTYLMLIYAFFFVLKKGKIHTTVAVCLILLAAFAVCQLFLSVNILRMVKFFVNLLFVYNAMCMKLTQGYKKVFLFYVAGVTISSAIAALGLIPHLADYIGAKSLGYEYDGVLRFAGIYGDPNYYSVNVIISLCLVVVLNYKKQLDSVIAVLLGVLLVVFAGMTSSKSAFLMLLAPATMLLYSKVKAGKIHIFLLMTFAMFVFVLAVFSGKIEVFNTVLLRLFGENAGSLTTGRVDLWIQYMEYLQGAGVYLLVGKGFGAALLNDRAAHNTYLDMLYYLGVVGTGILVALLIMISKLKAAPEKRNLLNYSVLLSVLALYFFLSEMLYFDCAFHILLAILLTKTPMVAQEKRGNAGLRRIY